MILPRALLAISVLSVLHWRYEACSTPRPVQDAGREDPRFGPEAEAEFDARLARIREEIAKLGTGGWAAIYYCGNGLSVNVEVELAPKSGFVFTWRGCLGLLDSNYGTATEKGGRLELAFHFINALDGYSGLAPVFVPVKWGERRYLIASDELLAFANEVNGGSEPRQDIHGSSLLRIGDEAKPATGKPELPKEAADLLLDQPVEGTLLTVHETRIETVHHGRLGDWKFRMTAATIDRGMDDGLRVGHSLHFRGRESQGADATVIELTAHAARIRIRDLGGEKAPVPESGWKWSTRF